MLILNMKTKRQRRPNVRLGEIGDVPAAFACDFAPKTMANFGQEGWKNDFLVHEEPECNPICAFSQQRSSEATLSDPGVSPRISADVQQNREKKNPNWLKPFDFGNSDENDFPKFELNFGSITRKCRLMTRRRRSTSSNYGGFSGAYNCKISPENNSVDEKECGGKEPVVFKLNGCLDNYHVSDFNNSPGRQASATSKEVCEDDTEETTCNERMQGKPNGFWNEGSCYEGNNAFPKSLSGCDKVKISGNKVDSVREWLEELGFGKYTGLFEMHEVDEQALPLLTVEDLKEMGVLVVGPRRKLGNAIQQLREGGERITA